MADRITIGKPNFDALSEFVTHLDGMDKAVEQAVRWNKIIKLLETFRALGSNVRGHLPALDHLKQTFDLLRTTERAPDLKSLRKSASLLELQDHIQKLGDLARLKEQLEALYKIDTAADQHCDIEKQCEKLGNLEDLGLLQVKLKNLNELPEILKKICG